MAINRLTDRKVQTAKCPPEVKAKFYSDGGGLYLRVSAAGGRSWIYRYMRNGRSHDIGLGPLHTVSLAEARDKARELRKLKYDGKDPLTAKRAERQREVPSFRTFAEEYIDRQAPGWHGKRTAQDWRTTLRQHIFPRLGSVPLDEIDSQFVLRAIRPLWDATPITGRRTLRRIETILDAATAEGFRIGDNPARWENNMKHLLPAAPAAADHHHESMPYQDVPEFLRSLKAQRGDAARALRFLILTSVRRGELLGARLDEFDLEARIWAIPGQRMKMKNRGEFRVPLSDAAIGVLQENPGRSFPIAGSAMPMLLRRRGVTATVHGFRSSFRTWAAEQTNFAEEVAEACLAHVSNDKTVAAYQRGDRVEQRRRLMEAWGRYCCGSTPAEVIPLRA